MASSSVDGHLVEYNEDTMVSDGVSLQGTEFMELRNFMPGRGPDFRNTCFVAVVANLRHLLRPVHSVTSKLTWTQFVTFVRQSLRDRSGQLLFSASDGSGQHDAAALLGEFLSAVPNSSFGTRIRKTKKTSCCGPMEDAFETLHMIVLALPLEVCEYSLKSLIDYYESEITFDDLECDSCLAAGRFPKTAGSAGNSIYDTVDGKMVFRFNRYDAIDRRADRILLDTSIISKTGDTYNLEAILQHQGESSAHGHYIIFVLVSGHWEERDDAKVKRRNLAYEPSNVRSIET